MNFLFICEAMLAGFGGYAFGCWQHDYNAGSFMFIFMLIMLWQARKS